MVVEVDKFSPVFHEEVRLIVDEDDDDKNDDDEGTSNRAGGMSSQQIQEIVDHHNALRAGEGASNMETMVCDRNIQSVSITKD